MPFGVDPPAPKLPPMQPQLRELENQQNEELRTLNDGMTVFLDCSSSFCCLQFLIGKNEA